jgi:hypothetical protein
MDNLARHTGKVTPRWLTMSYHRQAERPRLRLHHRGSHLMIWGPDLVCLQVARFGAPGLGWAGSLAARSACGLVRVYSGPSRSAAALGAPCAESRRERAERRVDRRALVYNVQTNAGLKDGRSLWPSVQQRPTPEMPSATRAARLRRILQPQAGVLPMLRAATTGEWQVQRCGDFPRPGGGLAGGLAQRGLARRVQLSEPTRFIRKVSLVAPPRPS